MALQKSSVAITLMLNHNLTGLQVKGSGKWAGRREFFLSLPPLPFPFFALSSILRVATLAVRMRKLLALPRCFT